MGFWCMKSTHQLFKEVYMKKVSSLFLILTLLVSATAVFAQQGAVIKGTVTDENGDPLQGANVIIEGTAIGATRSYGQATDSDGNYEFIVYRHVISF